MALVRRQIEDGGERLWRLDDFRDLPFEAVAQALSRLTRQGRLARLSKGIYYRSRQTAFGKSQPNPAAIQKLASRRKGVFPSGIAAANLLGFTTQTASRSEVATSALSLPRKLVGSDTVIHTRRPEAWASLSENDAALLDFCAGGQDERTVAGRNDPPNHQALVGERPLRTPARGCGFRAAARPRDARRIGEQLGKDRTGASPPAGFPKSASPGSTSACWPDCGTLATGRPRSAADVKLFEHPGFRAGDPRRGRAFSRSRACAPPIIEKDYYVTEALRIIAATAGDKVIFKGGTSLAKGWNLIQRFSEDIDIFLDPLAFKPALGRTPSTGN